MIITNEEKKCEIEQWTLEYVGNFNYLGTIVEYNEKVDKEMAERVGKMGR